MKVEIQNTKTPPLKRLPAVGELFRLSGGISVYMRVMDEIGERYFDKNTNCQIPKDTIYVINLASGALFWSEPNIDFDLLRPVGGVLKVELVS